MKKKSKIKFLNVKLIYSGHALSSGYKILCAICVSIGSI